MSAPRTAMVTGASRGIGRAIALALAADGYDVAVTARTVTEGTGPDRLPGSLDTTVAEIEAADRRALAVPLDLLDRDALVPAAEHILAEFGSLDVLVNNAIYVGPGHLDRFVDVDPGELERRIFGNLTAQLLLSQPIVRAMVERGSGTIVNITSGAGLNDPHAPVGEGGWALSYGCSKGGFHRMAGVLAVEVAGRGVQCFNVEPGFVATERVQADEKLDFVARYGKPPAVVGAVVAWLLRQPRATLANGSTISTDVIAAREGFWTAP
jgi:NAD(P)-dependent dehydrogenase (short-subunit alcohol dehydrogenase family)